MKAFKYLLLIGLFVSQVSLKKEVAVPGLKVRIPQRFFDLVNDEFFIELPYSINYLYEKPTEFHWQRNSSFFPMSLDLNNIEYGLINMDTEKFKMEIKDFKLSKNKVRFSLPLVTEWDIRAEYNLQVFRKNRTGTVDINLKDVHLFFDLFFKVDKEGNLVPKFKKFWFNFWKSSIKFENDRWFKDWLFNTMFKTEILAMQGISNFFGQLFVNMKAKNWVKEATSGFLYDFSVKSDRIKKQDSFKINLKQTDSPDIEQGTIDFNMQGFITHFLEECPIEANEALPFKASQDSFQVIISDQVVNCALLALQKSNFSFIQLNRNTLMEQFDMNLPISASSIESYLPDIKEYLGKDELLNIDVAYENPYVEFGTNDYDISFQFDLKMQISTYPLGMHVLDLTIPITGALDLDLIDEKFYGLLQELKVDKQKALKSENWNNYIGIEKNEYAEFIEKVQDQLLEYQQYINMNLFSEGIPIPYNMMKFETWAYFEKRHFTLLFDIIYKP